MKNKIYLAFHADQDLKKQKIDKNMGKRRVLSKKEYKKCKNNFESKNC